MGNPSPLGAVAATPLAADAADAVDRLVREAVEHRRGRGIVCGVVSGGHLIHCRGAGELSQRGGRPDADSLFRIASMTKSFTASAVLHLRDAGRLRLDDPIAAHVPEVADLRGPTVDSPAITVRHLLTMASGMATDDAWADRHLDVDRLTMNDWLRAGATFAHAPGEAYHYSNFGFAILGRAVENVSGRALQSYVTETFLLPLGMVSTVWTLHAAPPGSRVAAGHDDIEGAWAPSPDPLGDGDIAPMGGLWSTVRDLARWITFFIDAYPARDDAETMPLTRASRREMQEVSTSRPPTRWRRDERSALRTGPLGYGMGLAIRDHSDGGRLVVHTGGLPGFGSHMAWFPFRGLGVIALGNETYATMAALVDDIVDVLHEHRALPRAHRPPAPSVERAAGQLAELVSHWDDARAEELFADNIFLDHPKAKRVAHARELRDRHGRLGRLTVTPVNRTSGTASWQAERGVLRAWLALSPQVPPRLQWYEFTSVLPLSAVHAAAFQRLLALLNEWVPAEAAALFVEGFDLCELSVRLEAARLAFGSCTMAETVSCDGGDSATTRWRGDLADVDVALTLADGRIAALSFHYREPTRACC